MKGNQIKEREKRSYSEQSLNPSNNTGNNQPNVSSNTGNNQPNVSSRKKQLKWGIGLVGFLLLVLVVILLLNSHPVIHGIVIFVGAAVVLLGIILAILQLGNNWDLFKTKILVNRFFCVLLALLYLSMCGFTTAFIAVDRKNQEESKISNPPDETVLSPILYFDFANPESIERNPIKTKDAMIFELNMCEFQYPPINDSVKIDITEFETLCSLLPNLDNKKNVSYITVKIAIFSPGGIYTTALQNYKEEKAAGRDKWKNVLEGIILAAVDLVKLLRVKKLADYDLHRQIALRYIELIDLYDGNVINSMDNAQKGIRQYFLAIKIAQQSGEGNDTIKGLFNATNRIYDRLTNRDQWLGKHIYDNERGLYDEFGVMREAIQILVDDENSLLIEQKFPALND